MSIAFREVDVNDAKMILDWRRSPRVSRYMITDVPYDIEAQRKWISSIHDRRDYYAWVILHDDAPIGYINIQDFDFPNLRTSWGFYKGVTGLPGVGAKILPYLYNWLFFTVGIREIFTTVFYENMKAMNLYLQYGHTLLPEKDRAIYRHGSKMFLATLSLSLNDWDKEKYVGSIFPFPTQRWTHSPV
jgi:RimJ/RimL family protein N-acetyltransferase